MIVDDAYLDKCRARYEEACESIRKPFAKFDTDLDLDFGKYLSTILGPKINSTKKKANNCAVGKEFYYTEYYSQKKVDPKAYFHILDNRVLPLISNPRTRSI